MRVLLAALLLANAFAAAADEAAVRRMVQEKVRGSAVIESVRRAPFAGFYEVVVRGPDSLQIYYVDERASVIIAGQVFEAKSGRNLTKDRERQLTAIQWNSLPLRDAVTTVRGTGRRKIAIFSDPNCPYCKRLEKDLARLDDITVHILLYPVIRPESVPLVQAVWCSKDRAKAWNDLMLRDIQPSAKPDCDTPVEKLVALGRTLRANSTPTWFLETGERYSGAMPLEEIRALLDQASPERR